MENRIELLEKLKKSYEDDISLLKNVKKNVDVLLKNTNDRTELILKIKEEKIKADNLWKTITKLSDEVTEILKKEKEEVAA